MLKKQENNVLLDRPPEDKIHQGLTVISGGRRGFPDGSDGKESACNVVDPGSIPGSGRSLGEGNGNPLQCSCVENSMDKGAWQAKKNKANYNPNLPDDLTLPLSK